MSIERTRNFCIIAHIDHGKTTLSDRLLHRTGTIAEREMQDQLLDSMDLERERGITIKAHPVTMHYGAKDGENYRAEPDRHARPRGFPYEVSRSLSACEGALLIIDAAQGVEAQTVANVHLAMKQNLTIIPVINKIDLPHADVANGEKATRRYSGDPRRRGHPRQRQGRHRHRGHSGSHRRAHSAAEAHRRRDPAGAGASIPYFDTYKGVVTHVRVFNGELNAGHAVSMLHSGNRTYEVKEVGSFNPKPYAARSSRSARPVTSPPTSRAPTT